MRLEVSLDGGPAESVAVADDGSAVTVSYGGETLGTFSLNPDGSFTFVPAANLDRQISFNLAAEDGDGDVSRALDGALSITVAPPPGPGISELHTRGGAELDEARLAQGTSPSGSVVREEIIVPSGYRVDTAGWTKIGENYEKASGLYGKLVYDGESLFYELTANAAHDGPGRDSAGDRVDGVTLVDNVGNTYQVDVAVSIRDDVAQATLRGNGGAIDTGEVLEGQWSVKYGADGAHDETPLRLQVTVNGTTRLFEVSPGGPEVAILIDGHDYGGFSLTGTATGGGFRFHARPDQDRESNLSFALVAADAEDDRGASTLMNVQISLPEGPGVNYLGGEAAEVFYEANLSDGTSSAAGELTKTIAIPEGFILDTSSGVVVGGEARAWVQSGQDLSLFTLKGMYGTFTYTAGTNPSLRYTLEENASHPVGGGANVVEDVVQGLVLKDANGNSHELDAKVRIVDDVPELDFGGAGDRAIVSGHSYTGDWNVEYGADGEASGAGKLQLVVSDGTASATLDIVPDQPEDVRIGGTLYGSIIFNSATGKYVFTAAPDSRGSLDFILHARDGDGDAVDSGKAFTITVTRAEDPDLPTHLGGNRNERFYEANLTDEDGRTPGTDPDQAALTNIIAVPAGYRVDTQGWTDDGSGGWTRQGSYGYLTYKGGVLSYTLESAPSITGDGKNISQDLFPGLVLKDGWENTFTLDAKISVVDDVPELSFTGPDQAAVDSGDTFTGGTWRVDYGADGPGQNPLVVKAALAGGNAPFILELPGPEATPVDVIIDGKKYGELTLHDNGTFSFKAEPNRAGVIDFTLNARDADGDTTASGGFSLRIEEVDPPEISHLGHDRVFSEAHLANGTNPDPAALTQELAVPQGFSINTSQVGWVRQGGTGSQVYKMQGLKGFLLYDAQSNKLTYTLSTAVDNNGNDPVTHDGDRGYDVLSGIIIQDAGDNTFAYDARIEIADDRPTLSFAAGTTVSVESGATHDWSAATFTLAFGADGAAGTNSLVLYASVGDQDAVPLAIQPDGSRAVIIGSVNYGTLKLNQDGSFSFKANPNLGSDAPVHLNLALMATDGDGDVAGTVDDPLTIIISKPSGPDDDFYIGKGNALNEANLAGGTQSDSGLLTSRLDLPSGFVIDTTGWTKTGDNTYTLGGEGHYGKLTWDGVKLEYTLQRPADNTGSGTENDAYVEDVFNGLRLKDANGNIYDVDTRIRIEDDVPLPEIMTSGSVGSGKAIDLFLTPNFGADGPRSTRPMQLKAEVDGQSVTVDVSADDAAHEIWIAGTLYGVVTYDQTLGNYVFTAGRNLEASLALSLIARDGDNDRSESLPVTITITRPEQPPVTQLGGGEDEWFSESNLTAESGNQGTEPDASELTREIALPQGFFISTDSGWTYANGVYTRGGLYGTFEYRENNGSGTLTYTLSARAPHTNPDTHGPDDAAFEQAGFILKDAYGNVFDIPVKISIYDDAPESAIGGAGETRADSGYSGETYAGVWNVDYGADGPAQDGSGLTLKVALTVYQLENGQVVNDEWGNPVTTVLNLEFAVPDAYGAVDITNGGDYYGRISFVENVDSPGSGNFLFTPAPNLKADFVFRLEAKDSEGDARISPNAEFTYEVDLPPGPDMEVLGGGEDEWFSERNLADGTVPDSGQTTKSIQLPDGYRIDTGVAEHNWVYQGQRELTVNGQQILYDVYEKVNPRESAGHGVLTYFTNGSDHRLTFTLQKPLAHSQQGVGTDDPAYTSVGPVTIRDEANNSTTLDTRFVVYDDQPVVRLSGTGQAVSGREYTGHWGAMFGADGAAASDSLRLEVIVNGVPLPSQRARTGQILTLSDEENEVFGSLTLNDDGTFIFVPVPNFSGTFTFDIAAKDGDNDVARAEGGPLAVTVAPPAGPGVSELFTRDKAALDEAKLDNGTSPDPVALSREIIVPSGYGVDTTGWRSLGNGVFEMDDGSRGKLVYDGYTLHYVLIRNVAHGGAGRDLSPAGVDGIVLVDDVGNRYTVDVRVAIADDIASASIRADQGAVVSGGRLTGAWHVDFGADGADNGLPLQVRVTVNGTAKDFSISPGGSVVIEVDGKEYGELSFSGDYAGGSFDFHAYPNQDAAQLGFAVVAKDGDGDVSVSSTIIVQISEPQGPGINFLGGEPGEELYERHLGWGSSPATGELTRAIALPVGFGIDTSQAVTISGQPVLWQEEGDGRYTLAGTYGTFTYIAGEPPRLLYTLEKAAGHAASPDDIVKDSFTGMTLLDANGNRHSINAEIAIVDDFPESFFGGDAAASIVSGYEYTGTWGAGYGADGASPGEDRLELVVSTGGQSSERIAVTPGVESPISINGTYYGSIVFNAGTGRYVFTAAPDVTADLGFILYVTDGDGDVADSGRQFVVSVTRAVDPELPDHLGGRDGEDFAEAALATGSNPAPLALTKEIDLPEGYRIDTGQGWTETTPGSGVWTRPGQYGTLSYDGTTLSYTLERAPLVAAEETVDHIPGIVLLDGKNNSFTLDAEIAIRDDAPVVGLSASGGSGLTLDSGDSFTGAWDVRYGADREAQTDHLVFRIRASGQALSFTHPVTVFGQEVDVVINGTSYGKLTVFDDGRFIFQASQNSGALLVFSVLARDGDGSESLGPELTVTVKEAQGPDITHLGHDAVFSEANFENGTRPDTGLLTQTLQVPAGFFVVTGEDARWVLQNDGSYILWGEKGFLTCRDNGRSLTYTLAGRVSNDGSDSVEHDDDRGFDLMQGIFLRDGNDNRFELNAKIEIRDDSPELHFGDNSPIAVESGALYASGADAFRLSYGADGAAETGSPLVLHASVDGKSAVQLTIQAGTSRAVIIDSVTYGTLTLNKDGTFTFRAAPNIGDKRPVSLRLGLTATDRDGDTADTLGSPVTITITKPSGPDAGYYIGSNGELFDEAALPGGTAADGGALTKILVLPEGYVPDTANWTKAPDGTWFKTGDGNLGRLVWDGADLTYTLERPGFNAQSTENEGSMADVFLNVRLKDANGNTFDVPVRITVTDDAPAPGLSADQTEVGSGRIFTGDVDANYGADGAASSSALQMRVELENGASAVVDLTPDGLAHAVWIEGVLYGTVNLAQDGKSYSFVAGTNLDAQLTLTVIARDRDGDARESAPVVVTVKPPVSPGVTVIGDGEQEWFSEANLTAGGDTPHTGTSPDAGQLTKSIALPEGFFINVKSGWTLESEGVYVRYGSYGKLTYSETPSPVRTGSLTYTLIKPGEHPDSQAHGSQDVMYEDMAVVLEDAYGNLFNLGTHISIRDDAPEASLGGTGTTAIESGDLFSGTWEARFGADGPAAGSAIRLTVSLSGGGSRSFAVALGTEGAVEVRIDGVYYGRFTLIDQNRFSFLAAPDLTAELGFSLTVTDADGDAADSGSVSISITRPEWTLGDFSGDSSVDEAHLASGTSPGGSGIASEVAIPSAYEVVADADHGWIASGGGWTKQVDKGFFTYENGTLSFTLTGAIEHGEDGRDSLGHMVGAVTVRDTRGNTYQVNVNVDVIDDVPELGTMADVVLGPDDGFVASGEIGVNYGADGPALDQDGNYVLSIDCLATGSNAGSRSLDVDLPADGGFATVHTNFGMLRLRWDNDQRKLLYEYTGIRGRAGDTETLTFSMADADGDTVDQSFTLSVSDTIAEVVLDVDEAGLPYGSQAEGHGESEAAGDLEDHGFGFEATSITWDLNSITQIMADGNITGSYSGIRWEQHGNTLRGFSSGSLVMEVIPTFERGVFTGQMTTVIHRAFEHPLQNVLDDFLEVRIGFSQSDGQGNSIASNMFVSIKDDMPLGNTGAEPEARTVTLHESGEQEDDNYIVVDFSLSVGTANYGKQVNAIRSMAQVYIDNGVYARFTVIGFSTASTLVTSSLTAEELLAALPENDYSKFPTGGITNYAEGLKIFKDQMAASFENPATRYMNKRLFFLTDGEASDTSTYLPLWNDYLDQNRDWLDVYAMGINVGSGSSVVSHLLNIADQDPSHVVFAEDFDSIANVLTDLVTPEMENLLQDLTSADVTSIVVSVTIGQGAEAVTRAMVDNGDPTGLKNTGVITIDNNGHPITLIIYENGDYRIITKNLDDDFHSTITMTVQDADGDTRETPPMELVIKDFTPEAYDNTAPLDIQAGTTAQLGALGNTVATNGWNNSNTTRQTSYPNGGIPSDPALDDFVNGSNCLRLRALTLSANNVQQHIGTPNLKELTDKIGISTTQASESGSSRVSLISREFTASGGRIIFGWALQGGSSATDSDAAFWSLYNSAGALIAYGLLAQLTNGNESGIARIDLPESAREQNYRLVIGSIDGGTTNGTYADLYVNAVAHVPDSHEYSGNIISDPSPYGEVDSLPDRAALASITYNGVKYDFSQGDVVIETDSGKLVINNMGDYVFRSKNGNFMGVNEKFTYTLTDRDGDSDSATLTVAWQPPVAYDNLAVEHQEITRISGFAGSATSVTGNSIAALDQAGWQYYGEYIYTGRGIEGSNSGSHILPPENPYLETQSNEYLHFANQYYWYFNTAGLPRYQTFFGTQDPREMERILQEEIGLQGTTRQLHSGNGTADTIDMACAMNTFTSHGGKMVFAWSFYARPNNSDDALDAAFWILKDAHGNFIKTGIIQQGPGPQNGAASGVLEIDVPSTLVESQYSLVLGTINIGLGFGAEAHLYVGPLAMVEDQRDFAGNVVTDPSVDGESDFVQYITRLESVEHEGQVYLFDELNQSVTIATADGTLTMDWNGNYTFTTAEGRGPSEVSQQFVYRLANAQDGNHGVLYVQQTGPVAHGNLAESAQGFTTVSSLGIFTESSVANAGWTAVAGTSATNIAFSGSMLPSPANEYIAEYADGRCLRLTNTTQLNATQQNNLFALDKTGMTAAEFLSTLPLEGTPYMSGTGGAFANGSFVSRSFSSRGGTVVFDWSFGGNQRVDEDEADAAIWILQDAAGNIVSSGVMGQLFGKGYMRKSGVESIRVPMTEHGSEYTLILGSLAMGKATYTAPELYVGTVLSLEDAYQFAGNVMTDASPDGATDSYGVGARLTSVGYRGDVYEFGSANELVVNTFSGGKLLIRSDGSYYYSDAPGADGSRVMEDFSYTISNRDGTSDDALLMVRGDRYHEDGTYGDDNLAHTGNSTPLVIDAGLGDDSVRAGEGNDVVYGGEGNDTLDGGAGNDILYGGVGSDLLFGGTGDDILFGGPGDDRLEGGAGNDLLYGGSGNNILYGGEGSDTFAWKAAADLRGLDRLMDFSTAQGDRLSFDGLLKDGESLDDFLGAHIVDASVDADSLDFTIRDGVFAKDVELLFADNSDAAFAEVRDAFAGAAGDAALQHDILVNFLLSLSS